MQFRVRANRCGTVKAEPVPLPPDQTLGGQPKFKSFCHGVLGGCAPGHASQTTCDAEELGPTAPSESESVCGPWILRFHRLLPCVTPKVVNQCKRRGQRSWSCAFTLPSAAGLASPAGKGRRWVSGAPAHTRAHAGTSPGVAASVWRWSPAKLPPDFAEENTCVFCSIKRT